MTDRINKFISGETTLDEISVSELEGLIADFPFADTFKVLLAKKMNSATSHSFALQNNDNVIATFQNFGELAPQSENLDLSSENIVLMHEPKDSVESATNDDKVFETEQKIEVIDNIIDLNLQSEIITHSTEIISVIDDQVMDVSEKPSIKEIVEEGIEKVVSQDIFFDNEDEKPKTKIKNSKKNKGDKFALKEYSGISEFSKWLLSFKEEDVERKIKKEEKAARKRIIEENARKSVTKSAAIISESLAAILASQGHLDDAKKMYEQLMHKYPEKSSYFAAKINNLIKF